ncbi:MAG TPA: hypothetical protein PKK23_02405 [Nitrospirales bacterium]|nr:hypothetical protein [Nitrospiraceae bacterium]HNP27868.1 hypothetical protein [Nitrospirales bacterium]
MYLVYGLFASFVIVLGLVVIVLRKKQMHLWIASFVVQRFRARPKIAEGPIHIFFCVADHYEPAVGGVSYEQECARVEKWMKHYPAIASKHQDGSGRCPQHTFFFPAEEYRPEHLDRLAELCGMGFGDVEIHLHHDNDTAENLREQLHEFKTVLYERHRLLRKNPETGVIEYGFIHGNWALDNSGAAGRWCGVNNEISILRETGCYADFTFPSAPDETQVKTINSLYYATDDPLQPKSHNAGVFVKAGRKASGDLLLIQGPLGLNWKARKLGFLPRIENGELSGDNPPSNDRVDLWIKTHIHVQGQPNWIFVKLHTHGACEQNMGVLLGDSMDRMWTYLEAEYNDGQRYCLHYVTAYELFQVVKAAESGIVSEPSHFLTQFSRYAQTKKTAGPAT